MINQLSISDPFLLHLLSKAPGKPRENGYGGPHPRAVDRLVSIVFYGRSGSNFVMSLLDGHPDLLCLGSREFRSFFNFFDSHGGSTTEAQLSWALRTYGENLEYPGKSSVSFVTTNTGAKIHVPADIPFRFVDKPDAVPSDGPLISQFIIRFLGLAYTFYGDPAVGRLSAGDFFTLFHIAYNECIDRPLSPNIRTIAWNMHVPDAAMARGARGYFPAGQFIHVVRRPTQGLGSHFKHYHDPHLPLPDDIAKEEMALHVLRMMMNGDTPLRSEAFADRAIRLEDIHGDPEPTLRRLCAAIGINWNPSLMSSTVFGKPFSLPSANGNISGFTTAHLQNQHTDIMPPEDLKFLENLLSPHYRRWRYEPLQEILPSIERFKYLIEAYQRPLEIERVSWKVATAAGVPEAKIKMAEQEVRDMFRIRIALELEIARNAEPPRSFELI